MPTANNPELNQSTLDYNTAPIDDIIYEHRNKQYGGYVLRKMYASRMSRALIWASLAFLLLISVPLIARIIKESRGNEEELMMKEVTLAEPPPLDPKAAPPPPPPPPVEPPARKPTIAFVAPKVKKDEEVQEEVPLPDVEELKDIEISTKTQEGVEGGLPDGLEDAEPAPPAPVLEEKEEEKPEEIFQVVEQQPSFPDGQAAMLKFIYDNIRYPSIAKENGIEGTCVLKFVVEKDGSITNIQTVRDIGGGCADEAERVIRLMPKWQPGKQRGKPVRVSFNIPVKFKLQ